MYLKTSNDSIVMCLEITLYSVVVPDEESVASGMIHKCRCMNIPCSNARLHFFYFYLCNLDLFFTPFASFLQSITVDSREEQVKMFSSPHKRMLGGIVYCFSLTTPREGTKNLGIKESQ